MRKVNDSELMQMIESGKPQKECAEHFGVSPSAINQRIKRLKAYEPPESFMRLTDKQQKFVLAKLDKKTNLVAVQSAYDVTSKESAKSLATQLMQDPDVRVAMRDLMAQEGIPLRVCIRRLRDMIECTDLSIAGKGLDMRFKLTGDYAPEKNIVIVDHQTILADLRAARQRMVDAGLIVDIEEEIDVTPEKEN